MRANPLLLTLLVVAIAATTAAVGASVGNSVIDNYLNEYQFLWGLAIAQLQLVVAATVFLRRWLALRTIALIACLLLWAAVFAEPRDVESTARMALMLLTVAIFTAAWCGLLTFSGWRLKEPKATTDEVICRRQFSLATLLLVTSIACVYGGLWRWVEFSWLGYPAIMATLMCSLAGCTMFKTTARGTWPWLPIATIVSIVIVVDFLPTHRYLLYPGWILPVLVVQIAFLLAVLVVLRVAGIYLVSDATQAPLQKAKWERRKVNSLAAAMAARSTRSPEA